MSTPKVIEGALIVPAGARFAIVASRFNHFIVDRLVEGALDGLVRHGADPSNVTVVRVPGAWEIPPVVSRLAHKKGVDAVLAVGAVIRGSTPHFDYVCSAASSGCTQAASQTGVPVIFGVITTDSIEQAVERAGTKAGNKGF
ncbi:MAG TPA: 6,7-dimethyl-8-ribityllumazine synthase, partial [Minicystis sp.]|nr:6,7-dimethyl-8-ribityllumazine synthase [Minicystis sp.]